MAILFMDQHASPTFESWIQFRIRDLRCVWLHFVLHLYIAYMLRQMNYLFIYEGRNLLSVCSEAEIKSVKLNIQVRI
jgi:hypothetical protein